MIISLSDGSREKLNPETIQIGEDNVSYCGVKTSEHEARYSRQAYYQMPETIEYDPHRDRYFVTADGRSYPFIGNIKNKNGGPHAR